MTCGFCESELTDRTRGRGRQPERFCSGGECRKQHYLRARRVGDASLKRKKRRKRPLFEVEIAKPENQKKVMEYLAWAEAQKPATPEAWGAGDLRIKNATI